MTGLFERVVVPLDATSENRIAIETAARLASRTKAPLHGIFVEDEDLLHFAGLPFARQVSQATGATRFTREQAELHLRAAAERCRRELFDAARRHQVDCTFEIVRGGSETALCAACERDLVVAGGSTRPVAGHFRLDWRWWSSIEIAPGPFLLARQRGSASGSTVVVLRDRGAGSSRLLDAAVQLAEARDGTLRVVCPPDTVEAAGFDAWVAERLKGHALRLQIEVAPADLAQLQERLGQLDCGLLAVAAGIFDGPTGSVRELVESFTCDVLFVR